MNSERDVQNIMENIDCDTGIEDEVLKLYCLFTCCMSSFTHEGKEMLTREYIQEKTSRILRGVPLILDASAKRMFVTLKLKQLYGSTTAE